MLWFRKPPLKRWPPESADALAAHIERTLLTTLDHYGESYLRSLIVPITASELEANPGVDAAVFMVRDRIIAARAAYENLAYAAY